MVLGLVDLPYEIREGAGQSEGSRGVTSFTLPREGVDLEKVRLDLLVQALDRSRGNKTATGKLLGLNRDQVRYWMRKFGLEEAPAGGADDDGEALSG